MGQWRASDLYRDPERVKKFRVGQEIYFCPDCKVKFAELRPLVNFYVHGIVTELRGEPRPWMVVEPYNYEGEAHCICDPRTFAVLTTEEMAMMDPNDIEDVILRTALYRRRLWGKIPTAIGKYTSERDSELRQGVLDRQCQDDPVVIYIPRRSYKFDRILPEREDTFMEGTIVEFVDNQTLVQTKDPCKKGDQTGSLSPSVAEDSEPYCIALHIYEALRLHPEWVELYLEGARLSEDGRNFRRGRKAYAELLRQSFDYIPAPVIPFGN